MKKTITRGKHSIEIESVTNHHPNPNRSVFVNSYKLYHSTYEGITKSFLSASKAWKWTIHGKTK